MFIKYRIKIIRFMNTSLAHEVPPEDSDTLSSISKQIVANNWKNIFQQLIEK